MSRPVLLIGISGTTNSGKTTLAERLQRKIPDCHIIHQDHYFLTPGDERLEYVPEVNHNNWEAYSSLDMDRMTDDVQGKKKLLAESPGSGPGILLVEGFNFFGHHGLNSALNPPLRKSVGMPSTPSCYLGLQVKALVDFGEEEEMPSKAKRSNINHIAVKPTYLDLSPVAALIDKKYFLKVSRDVCLERRRKRIYNPADPPGYFDKVVWPMYEKHLKDIEDQDDIVYIDTSEENSLDDICRTIDSQIKELIENVNQ